VEGQLQAVNHSRYEGTLSWVFKMPELKTWLTSQPNSYERILWIRGGPGVGKSFMAGFLIETLKKSNSVVMYFFCKRGEAKLTDVRDILRTLAYKCIQSSHQARTVLEVLMKEQFPATTNVPIPLLFTKLIDEPLKYITQDIYIILDGLDEADSSTMDPKEMIPEIEVLIKCLGSLKSGRILFISRPDVPIQEAIPKLLTKLISDRDNSLDITYVNNFRNPKPCRNGTRTTSAIS
jgi:hypothetical protein